MGIKTVTQIPTAASMSPPPTASIWSATPMPTLSYSGGASERHLWQYPDPGHQSADRPVDRPRPGAGPASGRRLARGPDRHARPGAGRPGPEPGQFRAADAPQAFNAQSNANAAFPPPTSLTGRDTGLLSTDALNFTGQTTIAVTDSSGNLVSRIDVDFDAGTLSVDGGATRQHRRHDRQLHHRAQHRAGRQWQRQLRQWPACRFPPMAATASWCRTTPPTRLARRHRLLAVLRPQRRFPVQRALRSLATGLSGSRLQRPGGGRHDHPVAQGPGRRHRQAMSASPPPPARPSAMW